MFCTIIFGKMILMNLFLGLISYTFDKTMEENRQTEKLEKEILDKAADPKSLAGESKLPSALNSVDRRMENPPQRQDEGKELQGKGSEVEMVGGEMKVKEEEVEDPEANESRVGLLEGNEARSDPAKKEADDRQASNRDDKIDKEESLWKEQEPIKTVFLHLQKGGVRSVCSKLLLSPIFSMIRIVFILLNTVLFGFIKYPAPHPQVPTVLHRKDLRRPHQHRPDAFLPVRVLRCHARRRLQELLPQPALQSRLHCDLHQYSRVITQIPSKSLFALEAPIRLSGSGKYLRFSGHSGYSS
jgi:hypothetical protein